MTKPLEVLEGEGKSGRPPYPRLPASAGPQGRSVAGATVGMALAHLDRTGFWSSPSSNTVNPNTDTCFSMGEAQRGPGRDFLRLGN